MPSVPGTPQSLKHVVKKPAQQIVLWMIGQLGALANPTA
jgi:hypothetical protein